MFNYIDLGYNVLLTYDNYLDDEHWTNVIPDRF